MATERESTPDLLAKFPASIFRRASPEELLRRRVAWDRLMKLRADIGPIKGITTAQLLDRESDEVDD